MLAILVILLDNIEWLCKKIPVYKGIKIYGASSSVYALQSFKPNDLVIIIVKHSFPKFSKLGSL